MKAFPSKKIIKVYAGKFGQIFDKEEVQEGMDLRDYFAAKAMVGILTMLRGGTEQLITVQESASQYAYEWADAMMKAREQK